MEYGWVGNRVKGCVHEWTHKWMDRLMDGWLDASEVPGIGVYCHLVVEITTASLAAKMLFFFRGSLWLSPTYLPQDSSSLSEAPRSTPLGS